MSDLSCSFTIVEYGFYDSSQFYPLHVQTKKRIADTIEIEFMVRSSSGISYINDEPYPHHAGRVIIARPGDTRYSKIEDLPYQCYYFHIQTDDKALNQAIAKLSGSFFVRNINAYVDSVHKILKSDPRSVSDRLKIYAVTSRILSRLIDDEPIHDLPSYQAFSIHKDALMQAKHFMDLHYAEHISIPEVCRITNLSPSYFQRLFTEAFGIAPGKYLQNVRLSAAKVLLITTNRPISDVAYLAGFSSQHYFTGRFKAACAISPLKFRQMMRSRIDS